MIKMTFIHNKIALRFGASNKIWKNYKQKCQIQNHEWDFKIYFSQWYEKENFD